MDQHARTLVKTSTSSHLHASTLKMNAEQPPAPGAFEWEGTRFCRAFRAAVQRRGYADEEAFFAHLHGDDEVILRDNGVTFHIAYQFVHRSDNNGMYVSSEDWPESPGFGMWF